ncbi:hypothetical protein OsI_34154 [Oryza sativa Indica Group]|uniref:Uncharacterized protein n=1 Tax=Oryza sativa subsp. indica TaxID=39946 RepID=A2Z8V8_ORYSI|nr:hypothetical protein OsI_34154 [Oryza sativa Indica Group]
MVPLRRSFGGSARIGVYSGVVVARRLHQNVLWRGAGVRHHWRPVASREGAGVRAISSGGSAGSWSIVAALSSMSGEARGRRPGATAGKASTTAPVTSRTAHKSPKKLVELLMHEAT